MMVKMLCLLIILPLAMGDVQSKQCNDESTVKLSMLSGINHNYRMKEEKISDLKESLVLLEKTMQEKQSELNITQEEVENLETVLNTTEEELGNAQQVPYSCTPRDCCHIKYLSRSAQSGLYAIRDPCSEDKPFNDNAELTVNCDMETDRGGWIVIQRRNASIGRVNFTRSWKEYENGFGDLDGEFWIGLKNIHELTHQQELELQVSVWNKHSSIVWHYPFFRIYGADERYALYRGMPRGHGDSPYSAFGHEGYHDHYFSTFDYYFDRDGQGNCGYTDQGGWWYFDCSNANLNGRHQPTSLPGTDPERQRLVWRTSTGYDIFTHSEMKVRPKTCGLT